MDNDGKVPFGPHRVKWHWEEYYQTVMDKGAGDSDDPGVLVGALWSK